MPLVSKNFNEIVTFSRASGATRVNSAGLIVGVDFSSTSNTITTGSKTFTLAADLNVNRDWPVGSSVIAVSQAGATGSMTGTVTSYDPATQALVINVTSIVGSGTSTNWRIGSLEARVGVFADRDPVTLAAKGGLVEGGATNLLLRSEEIDNAYFSKTAATVLANATVSPSGLTNGAKIIETAVNDAHAAFRLLTTGNVLSVFAKEDTRRYLQIYLFTSGTVQGVLFDLRNGAFVEHSSPSNLVSSFSSEPAGNGWYRLSIVGTAASFNQAGFVLSASATPTYTATRLVSYLGDGVSGCFIWGAQTTSGPSSYIPTTTVAVTRAADLLNIDGTRFGQFYNSAQGTIVYEMTPIASAVSAVAGSLNDGTLNNAIRVAQKQSGTLGSIRKMATDGVTDVMAINAATGNTLRANGVDYTEVSDQSGVAKLGVASSGVGSFLNVGGTENFRSSADSGQTYDAKTIGGTFQGAHFGIGRFVIAGSTATINGATVGSVIVSTDGLGLRRVNIPGLTQQLSAVTSNATSLYVAVGVGGVIYTSPDAETWTARTSGVATDFISAAFGAGTFVAVNATAANSRYSTDGGVTWLAVTGLAGNVRGVVWTGTQFVAVNSAGAIFTSANGQAFTAVTTTGIAAGTYNGIAHQIIGGNDYYVIVANGGQVAAAVVAAGGSPATWTTYTNAGTPSTTTGQTISRAGSFANKFYLVGVSQALVEFDPVAVTFTSRTANVTASLNGISASGTSLLICGSNGAITTSEDGVTFTSRTGNAAPLNGAAFGNGTYVIVGNAVNGSGLIATVNPTDFTYQRRVSGITTNINGVAYVNGAFYALAAGFILRSTDGISWTTVYSINTTVNLADIAFSGTEFIVTSLVSTASGAVVFSADGLTWSSRSIGITEAGPANSTRAIAVANGLIVIVGNAGTIITSPNGTTWTLRTSGTTANLFSVMYSTRDQQWYAAGDNGTILRSADAITWENISNDAVGAVINGGTVQANPALANLIVGATNKVAMRLQANNVAVSVNGMDAVIDTSVSLPTVDRLSIGMNGVSGQQWNGWIRSIAVYTDAKSNSDLKTLSTL